jgi:hypothetical protein
LQWPTATITSSAYCPAPPPRSARAMWRSPSF